MSHAQARAGDTLAFKRQYGPWALIAGASHGSRRGIRPAIGGTRSELRAGCAAPGGPGNAAQGTDSGAWRRGAGGQQDLSRADAADRLCAAVAQREIGLLVYNAGGDPFITRFLATTLDNWDSLLHLNASTPMACCHVFGGRMLSRGRGG